MRAGYALSSQGLPHAGTRHEFPSRSAGPCRRRLRHRYHRVRPDGPAPGHCRRRRREHPHRRHADHGLCRGRDAGRADRGVVDGRAYQGTDAGLGLARRFQV
ncbi:hypothetical protein G6F46_015567 [Rhizopus delemar]|nr:hypothetical protein G6F46_015567 [Rhizopus delemar]